MCGIAIAFKKGKIDSKQSEVVDIVHSIFEDQMGRGTQGFGTVKIKTGGKVKVMRSTELISTLLNFRFDCKGAKGILFHHRHPTSTPNKMGQTHPIFVSNDLLSHDYYVVHNGVIRNEDERKTYHDGLGFKYTTEIPKSGSYDCFNDSEAVAIDFALAIESLEDEIKCYGSAALVALQIDKTTGKATKIYAWRNNNPLNIYHSDENLIMSSEGPGIQLNAEKLLAIDLETYTEITTDLKQATAPVPAVVTPTYPRYPEAYGHNQNNPTHNKWLDSHWHTSTCTKSCATHVREHANSELEAKLKQAIIDENTEVVEDALTNEQWNTAWMDEEMRDRLLEFNYKVPLKDAVEILEETFERLNNTQKFEYLDPKIELKAALGKIATIYNDAYDEMYTIVDDVRLKILKPDEYEENAKELALEEMGLSGQQQTDIDAQIEELKGDQESFLIE